MLKRAVAQDCLLERPRGAFRPEAIPLPVDQPRRLTEVNDQNDTTHEQMEELAQRALATPAVKPTAYYAHCWEDEETGEKFGQVGVVIPAAEFAKLWLGVDPESDGQAGKYSWRLSELDEEGAECFHLVLTSLDDSEFVRIELPAYTRTLMDEEPGNNPREMPIVSEDESDDRYFSVPLPPEAEETLALLLMLPFVWLAMKAMEAASAARPWRPRWLAMKPAKAAQSERPTKILSGPGYAIEVDAETEEPVDILWHQSTQQVMNYRPNS
jgi:hypothetical protein